MQKKASMERQTKKIKIVLISIALHGTILALLLLFYTSPEHEWTYFDTTTPTNVNTPETIFSEPLMDEQPPLIAQPSSQEQTWAELKPRASSFGDSIDLSDDKVGVETEESIGDDSFDESDQDENNDATHSLEVSPEKSYEDFQPLVSSEHLLESRNASAKTTSKKVSAKKRQAQKALASITRGYLEQLQHEGENLIKTIGGDPTKMPSAEQLKYERYLAKIQWCLQNAHNINRDKCQMHQPIEATMRVYFTLDRTGKMADLKIMQSSGDPFVDRYIRTLFEQASSSFPPLPAYIKEDPYQLLYTVMVCWNIASPTAMGFMRE